MSLLLFLTLYLLLYVEVSYPWASSRIPSSSASTSSLTPARASSCSVLLMLCWHGCTPSCSSSECQSGPPSPCGLGPSVITIVARQLAASRPWRSSSFSRRHMVARSRYWCCTAHYRGHLGDTTTLKKSAMASGCYPWHHAARTFSLCPPAPHSGQCGRSTTGKKSYDLLFIAAMKIMSTWCGCTNCCFSGGWHRRRRTFASLWCIPTQTWRFSCRLRGSREVSFQWCWTQQWWRWGCGTLEHWCPCCHTLAAQSVRFAGRQRTMMEIRSCCRWDCVFHWCQM